MDASHLNWISNYLFGIADDVLRDVFVRGKYRDVILPMVVLRRLDAVLEPTKQAVLDMNASLDKAGVTNKEQALRQAAGQAFYNTSKFTMRDLAARSSQQQLRSDFEDYLDGFSSNVQDILDNFEFRNSIPKLSKSDALGTLIGKMLSRDVNLSPNPVMNADGSVRHEALDNHGIGTIFEDLVRKWNEENNEEAGEHWTPRDAVRLMANLIFRPIADSIESGTYLIYDGACGTGGMLTVAEETLQQLAAERGKQISIHLYGQEIQAETYAIAKADLLLKGEGDAADNIVGGPEHSTLSNDAFPAKEFDFSLSNPPYGKSWKTDLERMGGKKGIRDPRFLVSHGGDPEYSLLTRSSDGQMLFLANLLSKMKHSTRLGSRIAEVHNASSLVTGDAGQGESNVRRWILENDWLEAIVALPPNMFYNTDLNTYIWVLTNRKTPERAGRVQLIDATRRFQLLPKNLGDKNCFLSDSDIEHICGTFLAFVESDECVIVPNEDLGYQKVVVERPLRLRVNLTSEAVENAERVAEHAGVNAVGVAARAAQRAFGQVVVDDYDAVLSAIESSGIKLPATGLKKFRELLCQRDAAAKAVRAKTKALPQSGWIVGPGFGEGAPEPDPDLRDWEYVPLKTPGGIEGFMAREVWPHAPDAWVDPGSAVVGYEISFLRYFAPYDPPKTPAEVAELIKQLEAGLDGSVARLLALGGEQ